MHLCLPGDVARDSPVPSLRLFLAVCDGFLSTYFRFSFISNSGRHNTSHKVTLRHPVLASGDTGKDVDPALNSPPVLSGTRCQTDGHLSDSVRALALKPALAPRGIQFPAQQLRRESLGSFAELLLRTGPWTALPGTQRPPDPRPLSGPGREERQMPHRGWERSQN